MRVTRDSQGHYVIHDEPLRLEGSEAAEFRASMHARDVSGNDQVRQRFLSECAATYRMNAAKLRGR